MKTLKKILSAALGALLALSLSIPALAAESLGSTIAVPISAPVEGQTPVPANVQASGVVTILEDGKLHLKNPNEQAGLPEIILDISKAVILDAASGQPKTAEDIKDGEYIYAWANPIMALSMPPQAGAQLVICSLPQDFAAPSFHQVVEVLKRDESAVTVLTDKNETITIDSDCALSPYLTKNIVTTGNIIPGARFVLWSANVAEDGEIPVYKPYKAVVLSYAFKSWLEIDEDGAFLGDEALDLMGGEVYTDADGALMLPLRPLCEALGWEIEWDGETRMVTASNGDSSFCFTIGEKEIVVEGDMVMHLSAQPQLKGGRTHISVADAAWLLNIYYPQYQ